MSVTSFESRATVGGYEAWLKDHYTAVQARLRGTRPIPRVKRIPPPAPSWFVPEPVPYEVDMPVLAAERWKGILREVGFKHKVSVRELRGPARTGHLNIARQEAMFRLREETQLSWPQIGRFFSRDHTTILHGYRMHKKRLEAAAP